MSAAPDSHEPHASLGDALADDQMAEYAEAAAARKAGKPTPRLDRAAYICLVIFIAAIVAWLVGSL